MDPAEAGTPPHHIVKKLEIDVVRDNLARFPHMPRVDKGGLIIPGHVPSDFYFLLLFCCRTKTLFPKRFFVPRVLRREGRGAYQIQFEPS
jgi:hypothetical protein